MKIPNNSPSGSRILISLARIVSEDSQQCLHDDAWIVKSSKDS